MSQTGIITKSRSKPRNILRGIVPTYTGFDNATPTALENATDGTFSTSSGTATKETTGGGVAGTIIYDLGSRKNVIIFFKLGMWINTGTMYAYIEGSDDNITYNSGPVVSQTASTSEAVNFSNFPVALNCRYFRIRFYNSAAAIGNMKLYEVNANELG